MKNKRINYQNIHNKLIESVIASPNTCDAMLEECRVDFRYKYDEKYKVVVDTSVALMYEMKKKYELASQLTLINIEVARKLAMWEVLVYNYNTLGNVYGYLNMKEKSLEALLEVVRLEKAHQLIQMTSIAYINIGGLYLHFDLQKSLDYFKLAFKHVEKYGKKLQRYHAKMYFVISKLIMIYSIMKAFDIADEYIVSAKYYTKGIDRYEVVTYKESMVIYYLYQQNYETSKEILLDVSESLLMMDNQIEYLQVMGYYGELCQKLNVPYQYYIPILEAIDLEDYDAYPTFKLLIINTLINYYIDVKAEDELFDAYNKFIQCKQVNIKIKKEHQLLSIELVKQDAIIKNENKWIKERREELNALIDQMQASKDALEFSNDQMNLIYELGQIIMLSESIQDTIQKLYKRLDKMYHLSDFWVVGYEYENKLFNVLGGYINRKKINKSSAPNCQTLQLLQEYFTEKKIVISNRLIKAHDVEAEDEIIILDKAVCIADVYLPLCAQNKLLGVLLMRYEDDKRMNQHHADFLKRMQTFLSIALNNINYSFQLKHEISEYEEAQRQLTVLNQALYDLSKYDNLTKVYNRRTFDLKFKHLFNQAVTQRTSVACFMMDIDHFKLYNDTYGHVKGDQTLIAVANQIKYIFLEDNALFARYGGEEFIAFVAGVRVDNYNHLAQSILNAVRELNIESKASELGIISISVGCAIAENIQHIDTNMLIKYSDKCLYEAKAKGRNRAQSIVIDN